MFLDRHVMVFKLSFHYMPFLLKGATESITAPHILFIEIIFQYAI